MPDFNHEYLATLKDSHGNRCEALLAIVESGDRITGRYAFQLLDTAIPDGWRFPTQNALVEGEIFSSRTFPFENPTDHAIAKMQAEDGGHGLHARLTIGSATYYVLILDYNSRSMALCNRDNIKEVALPTHNDFDDFWFDLLDEQQFTRRRQLFHSWLETEAEPAIRAKVENLASTCEEQAAHVQALREAHLLIHPRRPGQHTDFSGKYRYVADNSYSGDFVEGWIELIQCPDTGKITGTYIAPSEMIGSVNWFYPTASGPVTGEAFMDRDGWHFDSADVYSTWAMNENYFRLPGGLREARIQFCGITCYLLRTADGCLAMSDRDSVTDGGLVWRLADA